MLRWRPCRLILIGNRFTQAEAGRSEVGFGEGSFQYRAKMQPLSNGESAALIIARRGLMSTL